MLVSSQAVYRCDLCTRGLQYRYQTTVDQNSIHQNGTRTTLAFATAFFGARQSNLYPQYVQQSLHGKSADGNRFPIHDKIYVGLRGRLRNIAHRLLSANAGAVPCKRFAVRASKISSGSNGIELKETPRAS